MRIWDVPPECLCRAHLLGEHRELHAVWSIIVGGKTGYSRHPEVQRWRGKLRALFLRHEAQVEEMSRRGYGHHSPLDEALADGDASQTLFIDTPAVQEALLHDKACDCPLSTAMRPSQRA
jgi:hypothetical protein